MLDGEQLDQSQLINNLVTEVVVPNWTMSKYVSFWSFSLCREYKHLTVIVYSRSENHQELVGCEFFPNVYKASGNVKSSVSKFSSPLHQ
jgi:hypothetical protein